MKTSRLVFSLALVLGLGVGVFESAHAVSIINGSFEQFDNPESDGRTLTGWTSYNASWATDLEGHPVTPYGVNVTEFYVSSDADPGVSEISQVIVTIPSTQYTLIFLGTTTAAEVTATLNLYVGGVSYVTVEGYGVLNSFSYGDLEAVQSYAVRYNGYNDETGFGYQTMSYTFTATGDQTLISFALQQSGPTLYLDLVSIAEGAVPSTVPEPGTMLLLGVGMVSLGALQLRKKV